ncbi:MAG: hypothetical protein IT435_13880 [Phycisphaerales bacterium]|nr:hypothetical protein [Phycisphaerales bacterium]
MPTSDSQVVEELARLRIELAQVRAHGRGLEEQIHNLEASLDFPEAVTFDFNGKKIKVHTADYLHIPLKDEERQRAEDFELSVRRIPGAWGQFSQMSFTRIRAAWKNQLPHFDLIRSTVEQFCQVQRKTTSRLSPSASASEEDVNTQD